MQRSLVVLTGLVLLAPSPARAQVACGDVLERSTASLTADLDCTGQPGAAVTLSSATLKLNGFTVRGADGILCASACKVLGPGVVENSNQSGIWSNLWYATRYTIAKVTIRNNALWGVAGFVSPTDGQSVIVVRDSVIESNGLSGIFGDRKVTVSDSSILANGTANGGAGVSAQSGKVVVSRSMVLNNQGPGVWGWGDARVVNTIVTGNELGGIVAGFACLQPGRATVIRSTVDSNASGACSAGECTDVASCLAPRVSRSTCDTSHQIGSGLPGDDWNVCSLD